MKAGVCIGVPFALFFLSDLVGGVAPSLGGGVVTVVSFGLIFAGVLVAAFKFLIPGVTAYMNYRARFKHEVAAEVFKIVCPTAAYSPDPGRGGGRLRRARHLQHPGWLRVRRPGSRQDRRHGVRGRRRQPVVLDRSGKNSRTVIVFRGLFFHLDFNKRLTGSTIVQPAGGSPGIAR